MHDKRTTPCGWWLRFEQAAIAFELAVANDSTSEQQRCNGLMRSNVHKMECVEVMAWLRPETRNHVQCVSSQRAMNAYHPLASRIPLSAHEEWQSGDFRLHVPGFDGRKAALLRNVSQRITQFGHACVLK